MELKNLLDDILGTGITQAKVAELINCSAATVSDIATGKQKLTNQNIFTGILRLHSELTKKTA